MSTSAARATAFCREAVREASVWTIRDDAGFLAPLTSERARSQPFWSLRSRAERVIATVPAYDGVTLVEIPLAAFRERWLPGLETDGVLVGLNWAGERATGYDLSPADVARNLAVAER